MPRIPTVISQQRPGGRTTTVPSDATADHKNTAGAEDAPDARGTPHLPGVNGLTGGQCFQRTV